jgi:hypothetical protein
MDATTDMGERHGRVLTELAELGLALARRLAARAEAAPTDEEAQGLALAFQRVARSVRQTLALETRLARERNQALREDRVRVERAVETRRKQISLAVGRIISDETEQAEVDRLFDDLDDILNEQSLYAEFVEGPVEAIIARICQGLGLKPDPSANDAAATPAASQPWPPPQIPLSRSATAPP